MDVLDGRVVHAARSTGLGIQRALEDRAEDGGADVLPVELGGRFLEQDEARVLVELWDDDLILEEAAVDVREGSEIGVEVVVAFLPGHLEHAEQVDERLSHVIDLEALEILAEGLTLLQELRVLCKEEEHDAGDEDVQTPLLALVVLDIAVGLGECVVELADNLARLDRELLLALEAAVLLAGEEREAVVLVRQILKSDRLVIGLRVLLVQVVDANLAKLQVMIHLGMTLRGVMLSAYHLACSNGVTRRLLP